VRRLLNIAGVCLSWAKIDAAIAPLLAGRAWSILAGPLTPILIAAFTTPAQQGLFYSFGSILAIQSMFELGFNQVLLQFVSHEAHSVRRGSRGSLIGGTQLALSRVRIFFRLGIVWYALVALVVLLGLGPFGMAFFGPRAGGAPGWEVAWLILVGGTALNVIIQPVIILINGLDYVAFVNRVRTVSTIVQTLALWGALAAGLSLTAPGFSVLIGTVVLLLPCLWWFRPLLGALVRSPRSGELRSLFFRVFHLQSKTALTWMTGFFVFQIFNPVLLAKVGAVEAGQFGMTQALLGSAAAFPLAWVQTRLPRIGAYLGRSEHAMAKSLFREGFIRAVVLSIPAIFGALLVLEVLQHFFFSTQRALGPVDGAILAGGFVLHNVSSAMVSYVRAHKQEPFVLLAWSQALVTTGSLLLLVQSAGLRGASLAYLLSALFGVVWCFQIFRRFWRCDGEQPAIV
jgi:O-antigen/teichoic acid export membrane protein